MEPLTEGVITGCDKNHEWLLSWWWSHYSEYNSYPVAFMDFGMTETALAWCRERGTVFQAPELEEKKISVEQQKLWEEHFGKGIGFARIIFLRKPLGLLKSPFPHSLWIDLDCRVRGNLAPLFQPLREGFEMAARKEGQMVQETHRKKGFLAPTEIAFNGGVIAFQREGKLLLEWVREVQEHSEKFVYDQHALSRAIDRTQATIAELSPLYNWSPGDGSHPDALVYHFHGSFLKDPAFLFLFN